MHEAVRARKNTE